MKKIYEERYGCLVCCSNYNVTGDFLAMHIAGSFRVRSSWWAMCSVSTAWCVVHSASTKTTLHSLTAPTMPVWRQRPQRPPVTATCWWQAVAMALAVRCRPAIISHCTAMKCLCLMVALGPIHIASIALVVLFRCRQPLGYRSHVLVLFTQLSERGGGEWVSE